MNQELPKKVYKSIYKKRFQGRRRFEKSTINKQNY